MADAGVLPDPGRLPWLEPYRAPANRKPSNRRSGLTAAIGAVGLAAVVVLLTRDMVPLAEDPISAPEASVVLPAPEDLQPQIVLPALEAQGTIEPAHVRSQPSVRRARVESPTMRGRSLGRRRAGESPAPNARTRSVPSRRICPVVRPT